MCGTGNDNSSNDSGGGDKDDKPAKKKKNIISASPNEQGQKKAPKAKAVAKPVYASPNEQGQKKAPKAKAVAKPVYASPNEQGQKKAPKAKAVAKPAPVKAVAKPKAAKPAKKNIFKDLFTPTPKSIAKNKIAGAKHTASQKAKGIGVARSNITDGDGNRIKGVANSETNPALVKLAKQGKRGAEGLNELARQQSATTGKDTSFKGVFNSLMSGEKHAPRQSLLEFGKTQGLPNTGPPSQGFKEGTASIKAASPKKRIALTIGNSSGGGGGSSQDTALAGGSAGRTGDVNNQKNMLAMNRKIKAKGKKSTRNLAGLSYSSRNTGLNIPT